jgi:hypothetical protein
MLVGKDGESDVESRHLQGYRTRLCRLRIDGLAPVSKYWTYWSHAGDMGLVNRVACSSIDAWLNPTASMVVLGEKLEQVPRATQPGWEVESGALFLGSSSIRPTLLGQRQRLPCTGTARRKRTSGVHGLAREVYVSCVSGFSLQGVHRFESPWLSDMSNRLACGRQHVVN